MHFHTFYSKPLFITYYSITFLGYPKYLYFIFQIEKGKNFLSTLGPRTLGQTHGKVCLGSKI